MEENNSKKIARLAIQALEDKKAEDIRIIDISQVSVIADYFIIAGNSWTGRISGKADRRVQNGKLDSHGLWGCDRSHF